MHSFLNSFTSEVSIPWNVDNEFSYLLYPAGSIIQSCIQQTVGLEGKDCMERLGSLKMHSQKRHAHREHYQLIFIWKISQGYNLEFPTSDMRGRMLVPQSVHRLTNPAV
jgi:hypothetical protein